MSGQKFRLITRSDMDGLVCGVLLKELDMIDEITFVHPKDMQDNLIQVSDKDISTNLPYVEGIHLAFDHHESETKRVGKRDNHIIDKNAPSAARVVYDYYGGKAKFPNVPDGLMEAVDKADAAQFSKEDVLNPQGWELLSFLMDARTGLGRFRDFRVSNYQLMMHLIDYCRTHGDPADVLALPDVKERVDLFKAHEPQFKEQLLRCGTLHKNCVVLDLRNEDTIYCGNRFVVYALFPQANISIHVMWGREKRNVANAIGKSIFDRSSKTNVGELCLKYGGGGHRAAGTCQVKAADADRVLQELITQINADG